MPSIAEWMLPHLAFNMKVPKQTRPDTHLVSPHTTSIQNRGQLVTHNAVQLASNPLTANYLLAPCV